MPPSGPPDPASLARAWTEGYPPGVPPDYALPAVALPRFLDDAVRDFPDATALVTGRASIDFVTVRDRVADVADLLRTAGVCSGDRVLVGLPGLASDRIVLFAIWRLAAVAVPVAPDVEAVRLEAILGDAEPVAAFVTRRIARMLPDAPAPTSVRFVLDDDAWLAPGRRHRLRRRLGRVGRTRRRRSDEPFEGVTRLEQALIDVAPSTRPPSSVPAPDDLALLTYPGGREGAIASTHANLVASAFQARLWVPDIQAGAERLLVVERMVTPAAVVFGMLVGVLSAASVICADDPDAPELGRLIERWSPTLVALPNHRVATLLAGGDPSRRDLTSLRVVLALGTPLDPLLVADVERRSGGGRVRSCFGLDAAALTHAQPVYGRSVPDALGLPVTSTSAAIVDPDDLGALCVAGRPGRLLVHGPQVARPYRISEDAMARRCVDGWWVSDELATVDADGVFHHVGDVRHARELVERGGAWVYPRQVESVLQEHPAVRRAGVVAGRGPGSLHAAVVCLRRGRPTEQELLVHCRAHLGSPAVPDAVILLDELPETGAGELDRDELRAMLTGR